MEKFKKFFKKALLFITNPRLLLCLGIGWIITNGWSYVMLAVGTYFDIKWMMAVGGGYVIFLWLPISPEKLLTVAIAIGLLRLLFPKDTKTLAVLKDLYQKAKEEYKKIKEKLKSKKNKP